MIFEDNYLIVYFERPLSVSLEPLHDPVDLFLVLVELSLLITKTENVPSH